jgi:hypothetical protein
VVFGEGDGSSLIQILNLSDNPLDPTMLSFKSKFLQSLAYTRLVHIQTDFHPTKWHRRSHSPLHLAIFSSASELNISFASDETMALTTGYGATSKAGKNTS